MLVLRLLVMVLTVICLMDGHAEVSSSTTGIRDRRESPAVKTNDSEVEVLDRKKKKKPKPSKKKKPKPGKKKPKPNKAKPKPTKPVTTTTTMSTSTLKTTTILITPTITTTATTTTTTVSPTTTETTVKTTTSTASATTTLSTTTSATTTVATSSTATTATTTIPTTTTTSSLPTTAATTDDSGAGGECKATNGKPCIFPFKDGEEYNECKNEGGKYFWCATSVYDSGKYKHWSYCSTDGPCPLEGDGECRAENNKPCVFPFKDGNKEYNECADYGGKYFWCATGTNSAGKYTAWSECPKDGSCPLSGQGTTPLMTSTATTALTTPPTNDTSAAAIAIANVENALNEINDTLQNLETAGFSEDEKQLLETMNDLSDYMESGSQTRNWNFYDAVKINSMTQQLYSSTANIKASKQVNPGFKSAHQSADATCSIKVKNAKLSKVTAGPGRMFQLHTISEILGIITNAPSSSVCCTECKALVSDSELFEHSSYQKQCDCYKTKLGVPPLTMASANLDSGVCLDEGNLCVLTRTDNCKEAGQYIMMTGKGYLLPNQPGPLSTIKECAAACFNMWTNCDAFQYLACGTCTLIKAKKIDGYEEREGSFCFKSMGGQPAGNPPCAPDHRVTQKVQKCSCGGTICAYNLHWCVDDRCIKGSTIKSCPSTQGNIVSRFKCKCGSMEKICQKDGVCDTRSKETCDPFCQPAAIIAPLGAPCQCGSTNCVQNHYCTAKNECVPPCKKEDGSSETMFTCGCGSSICDPKERCDKIGIAGKHCYETCKDTGDTLTSLMSPCWCGTRSCPVNWFCVKGTTCVPPCVHNDGLTATLNDCGCGTMFCRAPGHCKIATTSKEKDTCNVQQYRCYSYNSGGNWYHKYMWHHGFHIPLFSAVRITASSLTSKPTREKHFVSEDTDYKSDDISKVSSYVKSSRQNLPCGGPMDSVDINDVPDMYDIPTRTTRGHLVAARMILGFFPGNPADRNLAQMFMSNIFPQQGKCNNEEEDPNDRGEKPNWWDHEGAIEKAALGCINGDFRGQDKYNDAFYPNQPNEPNGDPRTFYASYGLIPDIQDKSGKMKKVKYVFNNYCCVEGTTNRILGWRSVIFDNPERDDGKCTPQLVNKPANLFFENELKDRSLKREVNLGLGEKSHPFQKVAKVGADEIHCFIGMDNNIVFPSGENING